MSEFFKYVQREYDSKLFDFTHTFGMREAYVRRALAQVDPTLPRATELVFHWMEENPDTGDDAVLAPKRSADRKLDAATDTPGNFDATRSRLNTGNSPGPLEINSMIESLVDMGFKRKYVEIGMVLNNNDLQNTMDWVIQRQQRDERRLNKSLERDLAFEASVDVSSLRRRSSAAKPKLVPKSSADILTISIPPPAGRPPRLDVLDMQHKEEEKKEHKRQPQQQDQQQQPHHPQPQPGDNASELEPVPPRLPGNQRNMVINELLRSEFEYVKRLHLLLSAFMFPCLASVSTPRQIIGKEHISVLFSCAQTIYNFHKKMLTELRERVFETPLPPVALPDAPALNDKQVALLNPEVEKQISAIAGPNAMKKKEKQLQHRQDEVERLRALVSEPVDDIKDCELPPFVFIGDYLLAFAPYFKTYGAYVDGHSQAVALLNRAMKGKDKQFKVLRVFLKASQRLHDVTLRELIDAPLHRASMFTTLVDELLALTHPKNPDHAYLEAAKVKMLQTGDAIMKAMERRRNWTKMTEINAQFSAPVPALSSHVVHVHRITTTVSVQEPPHMRDTFTLLLFDELLLLATGQAPYKLAHSFDVHNVGITGFVEDAHGGKEVVMYWTVHDEDNPDDPVGVVLHVPDQAAARQMDAHIRKFGFGSAADKRRREQSPRRQHQRQQPGQDHANNVPEPRVPPKEDVPLDDSKSLVTAGGPASGTADISNLRGVLSSQDGLLAFRAFLTEECSVENVMFWEDVRALRAFVANNRKAHSHALEAELQSEVRKAAAKDPTSHVNVAAVAMKVLRHNIPADEREMARRIVGTYFGAKSPCQVNLSAPIVRRTLEAYIDVYCQDDEEETQRVLKCMPVLVMAADDWASPEVKESDVIVPALDQNMERFVKARINERHQDDADRAVLAKVLASNPSDDSNEYDDDLSTTFDLESEEESHIGSVGDTHVDHCTVFDEAWDSVFGLMEVDSFRRFIVSKHFSQLKEDLSARGVRLIVPASMMLKSLSHESLPPMPGS